MRRETKGKHLKKEKPPILPFLVGLLLVVAVISSTVSSGIMAKYTTATTDSDTARVAEFVSFRLQESQASFWDIKPGESFPYEANIVVEKAGETAYQMYFDLTTPTYVREGSVADLFTFPVAEGWSLIQTTEDTGTRTYTYLYNKVSPQGNIAVMNGDIIAAAYSENMPNNATFRITARAEQVS